RLGARGGCESLSLGEQGLTERGARPGALEGVEVARLEEGAQLVRGGDRLPADRQGAGAADARKAPVSPGARRPLEGRGGAGGVSDLETKVAEFQPEKTVGGPPGSGLGQETLGLGRSPRLEVHAGADDSRERIGSRIRERSLRQLLRLPAVADLPLDERQAGAGLGAFGSASQEPLPGRLRLLVRLRLESKARQG